jgi:hypothetical protein
MGWTNDLGTPYHPQDADYYSGAAVAQMILESIGSGIIDQDTLYTSNHGHSGPGWYTSPMGSITPSTRSCLPLRHSTVSLRWKRGMLSLSARRVSFERSTYAALPRLHSSTTSGIGSR